MVLPRFTTFILMFYGVPFFILWSVIAVLTEKESKFTISKTLWLIAGFGLSHGIHELTEFFELQFNLRLDAIDAVSLAISFYFLIQFGISTLVLSARRSKLLHLIPVAPVILWVLLVIRFPHQFMVSEIGDVYGRYSLGLLGCFLTAFVFLKQRAEFRKTGRPDIVGSLYLTSAGFFLYGLVSGLIVPEVTAVPAYFLTYSEFFRTTGVPVQAVRAVVIIFIGYSLVRLLHIFEWERMSAIMSAKEELEREVQRQTAALAEVNKKLKLLIETEPECVKLISADGSVIQMNRAGLSLIDADSEAQVLGKALHALIDERYRQAFRDLTDRVFQGESGMLEFEIVGLKGRRLRLETHAAPLRNERNQVIALLGITRDITERKRAEVALQHREKQLSDSQRMAHIGSWERNVTTGDLFWSDELFLIFKLDPEKDTIDFTQFLNMIHPDDRTSLQKAIDETIQFNKPYSVDYRILLKDGSTRFIYAQAERRRNEAGQTVLSGTAQDITERKLAEEKIRQSEAKYRSLFESSRDGIFILDLDGTFIDANRTAYTRLGYTKEELLALHVSKLDPPEFARMVPERLGQIREQGFAVFESAHLCKDGTVMPVEINARLIEYGGKPVYLSVIRDITERKRAEQELRDLNRDFVIFLENTTDFVYFKDSNSRFRFCSQTMANITGRAGWRDMIGKHDLEVFPKDVARIYYEEELPVFREGVPLLNKTDPYYDAQGRMGWVSTSKWPVFDDKNRVIGIFGISRDITEQIQTEAALQRREKQLAESQRIAHIGSWERNLATDDVFWSDELFRIFGLDPKTDTADFNTLTSMIHPDDLPVFKKTIDETVRLNKPYSIDYRIIMGDGTIRIIHAQAELRSNEAGQAVLSGTAQDITERKQAEEKIRQSEAKYRSIFESSRDGIFILDLEGNFIDANTTAYARLGYSKEELLGLHISDLIHPAFVPGIAERMQQIRKHGFAVFESAHLCKDGRPMPVEVNSRLIEYEGKPAHLSVIRDITERKKMEEDIRHMAHHDALTGLPNRMLFGNILRLEAAQTRRNRKKFALLFLDLDRFKEINDTLGHDAGDQLLKQVSSRITKSIRESDSVARIGGDEFNILVADIANVEDVADVVQKIISSFQMPFPVAEQALHVTTSIGISIYPDDSTSIDTLLRYSDIAMYYAKERGRNNFQFYNPEINSRSLERIKLEGMLRQTIRRGELVVYYQPLVNIRTQQIVSAEALVRWMHPEKGILEPDTFIPAAEDTGFITAIDEYVLRHACLDIKAWVAAGLRPVGVTVNLSAREFQNPNLTRKIAGILEETGAPADYLTIEITESMAMSNIDLTVSRLRELTGMGMHAAIDDFGTGYSSLNHLKRLPLDKLKIDKSFIRDITTDPDDRTIIKAVTQMAHTMKLKVTAEGVETEGQFEFLKRLQCDEAQGFLFSSPLSSEQFEELIGAGR